MTDLGEPLVPPAASASPEEFDPVRADVDPDDPIASGSVVKEKDTASDVTAARNEAISYAAYRVLTARFIKAVGGDESLSEFADVMETLCYPLTATSIQGPTPAAVGYSGQGG